MVTRLLNICGLYLGPNERLLPPQADNPAGFWENYDVYAINEAILQKLGGGWDFQPPEAEGSLNQRSDLDALRTIAKKLINTFNGKEPWGWKDPRFCLTIPFWESLLSESRVIICLRHPLDVANSLMKRNGHSRAFGLNLWLEYNRCLLDTTESKQRLVTHYDTYFIKPEAELHRLVSWLGWSVPEQTILQACESISGDLRHHDGEKRANQQENMPGDVIHLYTMLQSEAGPIYNEEMRTNGNRQVAGSTSPTTNSPDDSAGGTGGYSKEAQELYAKALKLVEEKEFEAAIETLEALVNAFPEHASAHNDLAVVHFENGNHDKALRHLERASELERDNVNTLRNLGSIYAAIGRMEDALVVYQRVIQKESQDPEAWLMLANVNCQLGRADDAKKNLTKVLEINPDYPGVNALLESLNQQAGS